MIRSTNRFLSEDEHVIFFPSYGQLCDGGNAWKIHVCGVIIDLQDVTLRKRFLLRLLKRVINAHPAQFDSEIFRQRVRTFTASAEAGKWVHIRVGDRRVALQRPSRRNGRFSGNFRLGLPEVQQLRDTGQLNGNQLHFQLVTADNDPRSIVGRASLLNPAGLSVVSDIDDTIKHTQVSSRRELLVNTFLREFRCVEGMAPIYRRWAESGADFHYVSSSPWQLYQPLADLCHDGGFPIGTFHLRNFRLRDHMLRRVPIIHRHGKAAVIRKLMATFPQRKFFLIGDSGERDPEIYSQIARRCPNQVIGICIRELDERPLDEQRGRKVSSRRSRPKLWTFQHPDQLADYTDRVLSRHIES